MTCEACDAPITSLDLCADCHRELQAALAEPDSLVTLEQLEAMLCSELEADFQTMTLLHVPTARTWGLG